MRYTMMLCNVCKMLVPRFLVIVMYVIMWRDAGKPKQGPICDKMTLSRARFKYSLDLSSSTTRN